MACLVGYESGPKESPLVEPIESLMEFDRKRSSYCIDRPAREVQYDVKSMVQYDVNSIKRGVRRK